MSDYRIELQNGRYAVTVFGDRHGECGCPDSRTGYGNTVKSAATNCEWGSMLPKVIYDDRGLGYRM